MLGDFLQEVKCHTCGNAIEKGALFCKTCGRSRGINSKTQLKKFELIIATLAIMTIGAFCISFTASLAASLPAPRTSTPITPRPLPTQTKSINPTTTPTRVFTPTPIQPRATNTPKGIDFSSYACPDKSQVKLRVGMRAEVQNYDVNLRSAPVVPDVWDANIVVMLRPGNKMIVTGGPRCSHDGTWWEVNTDSGYTGWVREMQPNKILLRPTD